MGFNSAFKGLKNTILFYVFFLTRRINAGEVNTNPSTPVNTRPQVIPALHKYTFHVTLFANSVVNGIRSI